MRKYMWLGTADWWALPFGRTSNNAATTIWWAAHMPNSI